MAYAANVEANKVMEFQEMKRDDADEILKPIKFTSKVIERCDFF